MRLKNFKRKQLPDTEKKEEEDHEANERFVFPKYPKEKKQMYYFQDF